VNTPSTAGPTSSFLAEPVSDADHAAVVRASWSRPDFLVAELHAALDDDQVGRTDRRRGSAWS